MTLHVFAGPTVSPAEVQAVLPRAEVHPPVRHGDVLALDPGPGDTIAVIDGVFFRTGAIRHKELLHAMQMGAEVWGAASMGALRAAELHPFGMQGVGRVFRLYATGAITGDDEVAVLHAEEDLGHRQLSEALVNLRFGLRRARRSGLLTAFEEAALVEALRAMPFGQRSPAAVRAELAARGADRDHAEAVVSVLRSPEANAKKADAELLLRRLAVAPAGRSEPAHAAEPPGRMPMTSFLLRWIRSTPGAQVDGIPVSDLAALTACQVFAPDYPELHRDLVLRELVHCELGPGSAGGPIDVVADLAVSAAATRGLINGLGPRVIPPAMAAWLTSDELLLDPTEALPRALARSFRWTPNVRIMEPIIDVLRHRPVWAQAQQLVARAAACNQRLEQVKPTYNPHYIAEAKLRAWLMARWQPPSADHLPAALWDRGFGTLADLRARAAMFVPLATMETVDDLHVGPAGGLGVPDRHPAPAAGGAP